MHEETIEKLKQEITKLREENRKLRETSNQKIKQIEQEKQTLDKAAKYSTKQLAAEKVLYSLLKHFNTRVHHFNCNFIQSLVLFRHCMLLTVYYSKG